MCPLSLCPLFSGVNCCRPQVPVCLKLLNVTQTGTFPQCFFVKTEATVIVYSWTRMIWGWFVCLFLRWLVCMHIATSPRRVQHARGAACWCPSNPVSLKTSPDQSIFQLRKKTSSPSIHLVVRHSSDFVSLLWWQGWWRPQSEVKVLVAAGVPPVSLLLESPQGEVGTDGWQTGEKRCGDVKRLVSLT